MADEKEEVAAGSDWKDPAKATSLATLILIDGGAEITEENLSKLLAAAKCETNESVARTFVKATKKNMDLKDLIDNFGKGGGGGGPGAAQATGGDATAAPADEPEEEESKSSEAGPTGLFGGGGDDSSSDESSSD